ncbi:MAG TPA: hypothetical protein PKY87_17305 [Terricaulis sp.]|nr:hypothetical protein [Terricaulis sp.]
MAEEKMLGEINHQQRAHPVEGKALPHFGEEQGDEAARVAEEGRLRARASGLISHENSPESRLPARP